MSQTHFFKENKVYFKKMNGLELEIESSNKIEKGKMGVFSLVKFLF